MRILIATWDGAGGFQPQQTLIRGLAAKGHDVHVAAHQSLQSRIEGAGATFEHLPTITAYNSRKPVKPDEERALVLDGIIFSEAFGNDVYATASRLRPDLQLVDMALLTAFVAVRATGAPAGLLTTTVFKFVEWFGGQYLQRYATLKRFAARFGYDLPATWMDMIGSSPVIASTYRSFEPDADFPPGYIAVGPLREPISAPHGSFVRMSPNKPLILVSLSTGFMNQAATLNRLCQAIATLDVEAIVTTGEAIDPQILEAGPNTRVVRFISHDEILPAARLVVTHAGHGTVMAAISHAVPMLLLPMGRDQSMIAARTVELGLGAVMDFRASAREFAFAIECELADPAKQQHCGAFLSKLEDHPDLDDAISVIERSASGPTQATCKPVF